MGAHRKQLEKELKQTKAKQAEEKKQKTTQETASGRTPAGLVAPAPAQAKAAGPKPVPPANQAAIVDQSNVEYYTAVQEDVRVILKALGSGFGQLDPLPIAEKDQEGTGGVQARTLSLLNCIISSCVTCLFFCHA